MTFNLQETEKLLDSVGWNILKELQADARISYSELGRRVGLTSPAVAERVKRMEEAGIIEGYSARINPRAVGLTMTVFLDLKVDDCSWVSTQLSARVPEDYPEVLDCYRITGGSSFLIRAVVTSVEHLEDLINRLSAMGDITTSLVLSMPTQNRPIVQSMLGLYDG